jgi:uncharacterized protein YoxC
MKPDAPNPITPWQGGDSPVIRGLFDRLSHPFLGWYTSSFVVWNWKIILYILFSSARIEDRLNEYWRYNQLGWIESDSVGGQFFWGVLCFFWIIACPALWSWLLPIIADAMFAWGNNRRVQLGVYLRRSKISEAKVLRDHDNQILRIQENKDAEGEEYRKLTESFREMSEKWNAINLEVADLRKEHSALTEYTGRIERDLNSKSSELLTAEQAFSELSQNILKLANKYKKQGMLDGSVHNLLGSFRDQFTELFNSEKVSQFWPTLANRGTSLEKWRFKPDAL